MNNLLKGLEPNVKEIIQSILEKDSKFIPILQNDRQVFKVDKIKLIKFLVKTKINHITFYDIDSGTKYSILFNLELPKNKIEVIISEEEYKKFKEKFKKNEKNIGAI